MIRIISGKYKGRRIQAPKKLPVRPTTDMAKEALFNILGNQYHFSSVSVLDLFSGTGNISYEFASRGTPSITAVDGHYACLQFISTTAQSFGFDIQTLKSDVFKYLERTHTTFDIVFADPPYDMSVPDFLKIIHLIFEGNSLSRDGTLIIEHRKHTVIDDSPYFIETRNYGSSAFSFYGWPETDEEE